MNFRDVKLFGSIDQCNLIIQCPKVVNNPYSEQSAGHKIQDAGQPLSHIYPVNAEKTEERQQNPGEVVINSSGSKADISLAVHGRNQEKIDNPPDKQQAKRKQVNGAGYGLAVIKPMGTRKPEYPQDITDGFAVCIIAHLFLLSQKKYNGSIGPISQIPNT